MKHRGKNYGDPQKVYTSLSREKVLAYIQGLESMPTKREISKALRVKGVYPRKILKKILEELFQEGLYRYPASEERVRLKDSFQNKVSSKNTQTLDEMLQIGATIVGAVHHTDVGLRLIPAQRKLNIAFHLEGPDTFSTTDVGAVMRCEITATDPYRVKVLSRVGELSDISLLAAHLAHLPMTFSKEAEHDASLGEVPSLGSREDLRDTPLITIDGKDSRDFDDAVWAAPDADPRNPRGWHLIVAIADVAHYVKAGSHLDKEAYERGTSTYFPDRVIPMLPEGLSNGLCSLNPGVDRACLAVHIWIDHKGKKIRHRFCRGLMKSHARTTYEEVQRLFETPADALQEDLRKALVSNLFGAYHALQKARVKRGTLEIEVPEPFIVFNEEGFVEELVPRKRLDSHRLIEEMMILANVSAAESLEKSNIPCLYRVHEKPNTEKVEELMRTLARFKIKREGGLKTPRDFTNLLNHVKDTPHQNIINELVLRSQSQALYSAKHASHFGLNLTHYAHFTSPIRRYSDLLVHRGILRMLGEANALSPKENLEKFNEYGLQTSRTERRAQGAERDAMDRYLTHYLSNREGEEFAVYITGITKAGLFVTIPELNASGLVPMKFMIDDYYVYKENPTRLEGRRTKKAYGFGDPMEVRLMEADLVKGRLTFEPLLDTASPVRRSRKLKSFKRGRRRKVKR